MMTPASTTVVTSKSHSSPLFDLMDRYEQMIQHYWQENPDLYHLIKLRHQ